MKSVGFPYYKALDSSGDILIQGFAPRMARPSLALLVILFCGNIHEGLNQPLLDKTSMEELMRDMLKRQEEEVVDNSKWWLVEPRKVDSQLVELMKKKLERKMLKKTWQKYLSGEPNILQRMTKRWYNNKNNRMTMRWYNINNNNNHNNNNNNHSNSNNNQMTKRWYNNNKNKNNGRMTKRWYKRISHNNQMATQQD